MIRILFLLLITNFSYAKQDTLVRIELKESSMSLRKCKGFLFNKYVGHTFNYPPSHKITKTDDLFIHNRDTICFQIFKNGKLLISGKKFPEAEATDTINFYKRGSIIRKEFWVDQYCADSSGIAKVLCEDALYNSSDEATWIFKNYFNRRGEVVKTYVKTIEPNGSGEGACFKTKRIKNRHQRTVSCRCYN